MTGIESRINRIRFYDFELEFDFKLLYLICNPCTQNLATVNYTYRYL